MNKREILVKLVRDQFEKAYRGEATETVYGHNDDGQAFCIERTESPDSQSDGFVVTVFEGTVGAGANEIESDVEIDDLGGFVSMHTGTEENPLPDEIAEWTLMAHAEYAADLAGVFGKRKLTVEEFVSHVKMHADECGQVCQDSG